MSQKDDFALTEMRVASRRLSQSLFDTYESDWAGEEDLGAIVEVSVVIRGAKTCIHPSLTSISVLFLLLRGRIYCGTTTR